MSLLNFLYKFLFFCGKLSGERCPEGGINSFILLWKTIWLDSFLKVLLFSRIQGKELWYFMLTEFMRKHWEKCKYGCFCDWIVSWGGLVALLSTLFMVLFKNESKWSISWSLLHSFQDFCLGVALKKPHKWFCSAVIRKKKTPNVCISLAGLVMPVLMVPLKSWAQRGLALHAIVLHLNFLTLRDGRTRGVSEEKGLKISSIFPSFSVSPLSSSLYQNCE